MKPEVLELAARMAQRGEPFVLATAVWRRSPSSGKEGATALVSSFRLARLAASDSRPLSLRSAADVASVAMHELGSATRERVIALVEKPDQDEQSAGRNPVVQHLVNCAVEARLREGEDSEHDKSEVAH